MFVTYDSESVHVCMYAYIDMQYVYMHSVTWNDVE